MRLIPAAALLLLVSAAPASAQEVVKLFTDSGKTYLRSENAATLVPGAEIPAYSDAAGTKPAGKAIVMEVNGQLARIAFDEDAPKGQAKYVRLGRGAGAPPPPPPSSGTGSSAAGMPPPPPPPPPGVPPVLPPLKAVLGRGDARITVRNDSNATITDCQLKFPDRRWANAGNVSAHAQVEVGYDKIQPAPDLGDDWLLMRCNEGEAELHFNEPGRKNVLNGRAEGGRGGGVLLHNDGNIDWTGCDVIKPNGDHFFQGGLKAHAGDSIRGGLFKQPSGPEMITLTCAQGAVTQPVP